MSTDSNSNSNTKILVIVIVLLVIGIGIASYYIFNQKTQIEELQEESNLNKQQLEDEYESLTMQYEGFKLNIKK